MDKLIKKSVDNGSNDFVINVIYVMIEDHHWQNFNSFRFHYSFDFIKFFSQMLC